MAFNIQNFKSNIDEFLRPFTYEVNIKPPGATTELQLHTESISLPGVSFAEVDGHKPYGNGLAISIPHTKTVQEITCVHTVDKGAKVLQTFFNWANQTVNISGNRKFSAYYYNDYTVPQFTIEVYDLSNKRVKTYVIRKAYCSSYDQLQMSWGDSGEIARLSATYKFESFEVK